MSTIKIKPTILDTPESMKCLATVLGLPVELQDRIFSYCRSPTLATMCRLNKEWHQRMSPLLWTDIDFILNFGGDDPVPLTRRFFATCNYLREHTPERWTKLAFNTRSLNLGRLHGVNIVDCDDMEDWDDYGYFDDWAETGKGEVFDVIAQFPNLESLTVYLKNWWGYTSLEDSGKALSKLKNLRSIKTGGQMAVQVLRGLLAEPEGIQDLSLINLIESPGQDHGPEGVVCLSGLCDRFTSLKTLHLCKFADLDGNLSGNYDDDEDDVNENFASGMRWRFPRAEEVAVFEEWAELLSHCSNTIESLTLENRYLCSRSFDRSTVGVDPGVTHPAEYGAFSIRESQRLLFPQLSRDWPRLRELKLIGMGKPEYVDQAVSHLKPQVRIEQGVASFQIMEGDATPEQVSTPCEFFE